MCNSPAKDGVQDLGHAANDQESNDHHHELFPPGVLRWVRRQVVWFHAHSTPTVTLVTGWLAERKVNWIHQRSSRSVSATVAQA